MQNYIHQDLFPVDLLLIDTCLLHYQQCNSLSLFDTPKFRMQCVKLEVVAIKETRKGLQSSSYHLFPFKTCTLQLQPLLTLMTSPEEMYQTMVSSHLEGFKKVTSHLYQWQTCKHLQWLPSYQQEQKPQINLIEDKLFLFTSWSENIVHSFEDIFLINRDLLGDA